MAKNMADIFNGHPAKTMKGGKKRIGQNIKINKRLELEFIIKAIESLSITF